MVFPSTISPHLQIHLEFVAAEAPLTIEIELRPPNPAIVAGLDRDAAKEQLENVLSHRVMTLSNRVVAAGGTVGSFSPMTQTLTCTLTVLAIPRVAEHKLIMAVRLPHPLSPGDRKLEQLLAPGCTMEQLWLALHQLEA